MLSKEEEISMVKDWGGKRYNNLNYFLRNKFGDFLVLIEMELLAKVDVYSVVKEDRETLQGIGTFLLRSNL